MIFNVLTKQINLILCGFLVCFVSLCRDVFLVISVPSWLTHSNTK